MPFWVPASACSPFSHSTMATFFPFLSHPCLPPAVCPSGCLSPDAGFHYTSIGFWLLPSPQAPVFSLPPAAQFPRLCISTPPPLTLASFTLLFPPSVSVSLFLTISLFSALSFLSFAHSVLSTYSACHPNPPSLFFHSSFITTLPSFPSVLFPTPCSPNRYSCIFFLYLLTSPSLPSRLVYTSFLPCHPFLSSLSIFLSAVDGGAGCWPKNRRG